MLMWFNKKIPKTDNELQAELRALVDFLHLAKSTPFYNLERYEKLLREIYERGLKPAAKFRIK